MPFFQLDKVKAQFILDPIMASLGLEVSGLNHGTKALWKLGLPSDNLKRNHLSLPEKKNKYKKNIMRRSLHSHLACI